MTLAPLTPTVQKVILKGSKNNIGVVPGYTPVRASEREDGRLSAVAAPPAADPFVMRINSVATAVARDPGFWAAAEQFRVHQQAGPQKKRRPLDYPDWVLFFLVVLVGSVGSQAEVIDYFEHRASWRDARRELNRNRPPGFEKVPAKAPKRHHLAYFNFRIRTRKALQVTVLRAKSSMLQVARRQALAMGLLNDERFRFKSPDAGQYVRYDGTVIRANARWSGPGRNGHEDPGVGTYDTCGGSNRASGVKVMFASTRTTDRHSRVIVDMELVTGANGVGAGDEAAAIVRSAKGLKTQFPGMHGAITDGVLSGVHVEELARSGVLAVCPVHAKENPNRDTGGYYAEGRIEKSALAHTYVHQRNGRDCVHHIWLYGSTVGERVVDASGNETFATLAMVDLLRRGEIGKVRFYAVYELQCRGELHAVSIPMYHQPKAGDGIRFSRGEHMRVFPAGTWEYDLLFGRRNDTESLHSQFKRKMPKMPVFGTVLQHAYMVGLVINLNAQTAAYAARARRRAQQAA